MHRVREDTRSAKYPALFASIISIVMSFIFFILEFETLPIYILIISSFLIAIYANAKNIFHISIVSGHFAFWFMPALVFIVSDMHIEYGASVMCIMVLLLSLVLTDVSENPVWSNINYQISVRLYVFTYLMSLVLMFISFGNVFVFAAITGLITVAAALCMGGKGRGVALGVYISLIFYVAVYYAFLWSGWGRLIVIGILMNFTFMYIMRIEMTVLLKPIVVFLVPLGSVLGTLLRFGGSGFSDALGFATRDSAITPFALAMDIYADSVYVGIRDFHGWLDQFIIFLFPFIPREIWESKPLGFGRQYVVDQLDVSLFGEGYTIAATLIGEHVYYLGIFWSLLAVCVPTVLLAVIFRILLKPSFFGGYGIFIMGLWLPTYYWGGMQSFSSRFTISCLPVIFIYIAYRVYMMTRRRTVPTRGASPQERRHGSRIAKRGPS